MAGKKPETLPIEGNMPSLGGATSWLNSPPLTAEMLRGKVVLVDFWTYSCINCLRSLPYVKAWYAKYKDHGLVVIGVHAPEFAFEKDPDNVRKAVRDLGVQYPVALDNDYAIWRGFDNHYWPAHYFIDAKGQIRGHHFGEGDLVIAIVDGQQQLALFYWLIGVDQHGADIAADLGGDGGAVGGEIGVIRGDEILAHCEVIYGPDGQGDHDNHTNPDHRKAP